MRKTIEIDGRPVSFKASAAIPRMYRLKFQRDIIRDMEYVAAAIKSQNTGMSGLPVETLTMFEDMAFIMAKHADPEIPDTVDEWLDEFNTFSIYEVVPEILTLWGLNTATMSESKKKHGPPSGK